MFVLFGRLMWARVRNILLFHAYSLYMVRQFSFRNGPVKAEIAYLCNSGCCCLRNTLLVKLCTSWDDGATGRNSLENRFRQYFAVTSRWFGCQECQQIFVPSRHFFFNFGKSQKSQGAKSGEKRGWSTFVTDSLAKNLRKLYASCAGALSWWRIHLSGQSSGLFLRTDSRNLVSTFK
jgi:hypothetical protein